MLAVQPQQLPRMASDRSPPEGEDPFLPFGYSFDPNQEPPMEPPEPPTGAPLLSETDSKFLSSFFDDITSDQYSMPSFGEGLNFSDAWLDLPPQFMGSATSFGQQAGTPMASSSSTQNMSYDPMSLFGGLPTSFMMPPPPPPPPQQFQQQQQPYPQQHQQQHQQQQQQPQQNPTSSQGHGHNQYPQHQHQHQHGQHQQPQTSTQPQYQQQHPQQQQQPQHAPPSQQQLHSEDILNAAATLVHSPNQPSHGASTHVGESSMPRRAMGPPVNHLRHQPLEEFHGEGQRASSKSVKQENGLADWMMAPEGRKVSRHSLDTDFQWGSDPNFNTTQGYTPDANRETVESMQREQLKLLDSLEVSKSTGNTRPSSPSHPQEQQGTNQQRLSPTGRTSKPAKATEDPDAPPRKRRKSKVNRAGDEEQGDDQEASPEKPNRRRKSKVEKSGDVSPPPPADTGSAKKRRGTVNGGSKAPRENLTEEQKRENHIRSEQKRRTLIKEGFDDLCELVPSLNGGGFSKSTMLSIAGDYLEEIIRGNETLANQLASLNGSR